jgi:hypothetical protein
MPKYNIFGTFSNLTVATTKHGFFGQNADNIYDEDVIVIYEITAPFIRRYSDRIMSAKPLPIDITVEINKYLEEPIDERAFEDLLAYLCTMGGEFDLPNDFTDGWVVTGNYEHVTLPSDENAQSKTLCRVYTCTPPEELAPATRSALADCRIAKMQKGSVNLVLDRTPED